jgi:large subunit ribosomal protein L25
MAEITLVAEAGRTTGTSSSRRLRTAGRIPAVIYGEGVAEPLPVSVVAREVRHVLTSAAGLNAVLSVEVDGQRYLALARELQRHPVRGTLLHLDLQVVDPDKTIASEIPITLVGEAVELHRADGIVDQQVFNLTVHSRPAHIPSHVELDISSLTLGGSLRVSDLPLPDGVTTDIDPEVIVVAGGSQRSSRAVGEGEAGEGAGAEGAGAEGGEG